MTANYSRIVGTGGYLPEKGLTNKELETRFDTTDHGIIERTGISQRHILADHETTSTMAFSATTKALDMADMKASDLEMIIVGTVTPDRTFPSTAAILQKKLGLTSCPAFDVEATCSGFIYGLSIADQYIRTGKVKTVLVVGSEALSRIVDWTDRSTCILFSDGAGAVVLKADKKPGILSTDIHANGQYKDLLYAHNHMGELNETPYVRMHGREVFKVAVKTLERVVEDTLKANNIDQSELDWLVPHQANIRIIQATAKKLNLPMSRVILTVKEHGNTSAASIPLALDVGIRDGRVKPGHLILCEAFGAGFTWGSALIRF